MQTTIEKSKTHDMITELKKKKKKKRFLGFLCSLRILPSGQCKAQDMSFVPVESDNWFANDCICVTPFTTRPAIHNALNKGLHRVCHLRFDCFSYGVPLNELFALITNAPNFAFASNAERRDGKSCAHIVCSSA